MSLDGNGSYCAECGRFIGLSKGYPLLCKTCINDPDLYKKKKNNQDCSDDEAGIMTIDLSKFCSSCDKFLGDDWEGGYQCEDCKS